MNKALHSPLEPVLVKEPKEDAVFSAVKGIVEEINQSRLSQAKRRKRFEKEMANGARRTTHRFRI